jgi:hypothetical protein
LGLRLPATIAATIAYRSAKLDLPRWLAELTTARQVAIDAKFNESFSDSASNGYLKSIPRPPAERQTKAPITQATPAQPDRPKTRTHAFPGAALETAETIDRVERSPFLLKIIAKAN